MPSGAAGRYSARIERRIGGMPAFQIVVNRIGGALPMMMVVVETPFAAEQDQRHGSTAFDDCRRAIIIAIPRIG